MLNIIFFASLVLYLLATITQFIYIAMKKDMLNKVSWYLFLLAFLLNTAYIVTRGVVASRLPLSNQFEFSTAFAWGIALMYIVVYLKFKAQWISAVAMPAVFLLLSYAALLPKEITELMPALKSVWFGLHIGCAVFSYAAFVIAGCIGVIYLYRLKKGETENSNNLIQMDYLSYRIICLGFLLLTVVILSGCVWAEQAWGTFWSWDPKETWALITWIVYAIYLHQRLRKDWRGKKMAIFAIVSIIFVLFTFIGVNTLMSGLHSYK